MPGAGWQVGTGQSVKSERRERNEGRTLRPRFPRRSTNNSSAEENMKTTPQVNVIIVAANVGDEIPNASASVVGEAEIEEKYSRCFYCDCLVNKRAAKTGDHFPIPADCGGTQTVDCCESCHDMKDRFSFDKWPVEWTAKILADFPKLSRETRIFLARATALLYRHLKSRAKSQSDS